ncbi:hypothetical protein D3C71_581170 [compost metagenome]
MAGCVARAMIDLEDMVSEGYLVAILQPFVGHDILQTADTVFFGLHLDPLEQRPVVLMRPDHRQRELPAQFVGAAGMVEMPVRQPYFLERDAVFSNDLKNDVHIPAGINDDALLGVLIEQDGAILLEWRDRNNARLQLSHILHLLSERLRLL